MKKFTPFNLNLKVLVISIGLLSFAASAVIAQTTDRTTITKHTNLVPVIDGIADAVWKNADSAIIDATIGSHWGPPLSNPDDFVASVKTLWNGNDLFALIKVTDDELNRTNNWAAGDYFQISMDVNNLDATDYSSSGHFWAIRGGWAKDTSFYGRQPGQMSGMAWFPADIEFISIVDSVEMGGYWTYYTTLEIRFPVFDLGLISNLTDGSIVGLDFYLQDMDLDGTSVWCYDGSMGWDNPSSNGSFQMSAVEAYNTTLVNLTNKNNLVVYPNPVLDMLYIKNSSKYKFVEVIDVLGKSLITKKVNAENNLEIDLSMLRSGIYILKAQGIDNSYSLNKFLKK